MAQEPTKTTKLYKGKITIDFWENRHLYKIRETGRVPISVTAATGTIDKSRPLIYWATGLARDYLIALIGKKKPITEQDVFDAVGLHAVRKKAAATIGSAVHDWAEQHIKGKKPEMPTDEKVANGVIAFLKWVNEHKIKFLCSEKMVYSKKYQYVGLMDCSFTMGTEKHKIVHCGDFKTSKGIYPEMRFQVAAYQAADAEESDQLYGTKWIIRFDKETGDFEAREFIDHIEDFKGFLGCLATKKRLKELQKSNY